MLFIYKFTLKPKGLLKGIRLIFHHLLLTGILAFYFKAFCFEDVCSRCFDLAWYQTEPSTRCKLFPSSVWLSQWIVYSIFARNYRFELYLLLGNTSLLDIPLISGRSYEVGSVKLWAHPLFAVMIHPVQTCSVSEIVERKCLYDPCLVVFCLSEQLGCLHFYEEYKYSQGWQMIRSSK